MDYLLIALGVCVLLWVLCSKENENVTLKLIIRKFSIYFDSVTFMILSKDNKGIGPKKNPDPDLIKSTAIRKKRIVFIRHGESDWNNVFNKGINISLFGRLFYAMYQEFRLLTSLNSVFIDSPLNMEGVEQAVELNRFIQSTEKVTESDPTYPTLSVLAGRDAATTSVIVSSSLRRAIATTTVGLWSRVEKTGEKIHILSSLQEISRNVDTYALAPTGVVADLPFDRVAPHCGGDKGFSPSTVYNAAENFGNKSLNFTGMKRMRAFGEWAFAREEEVIIVGGHSLYFKSFFQTFLPHGCQHEAKTKKMVNSGVIAFDLHAATDAEGVMQFRIEPDSILNVFGGFTTK